MVIGRRRTFSIKVETFSSTTAFPSAAASFSATVSVLSTTTTASVLSFLSTALSTEKHYSSPPAIRTSNSFVYHSVKYSAYHTVEYSSSHSADYSVRTSARTSSSSYSADHSTRTFASSNSTDHSTRTSNNHSTRTSSGHSTNYFARIAASSHLASQFVINSGGHYNFTSQSSNSIRRSSEDGHYNSTS